MTAVGLVVLRLTLAVVLVAHGAHKLFGMFAGPGVGPGGLQTTTAHFTALGLEPGFALAVLAGVTQLTGGCLIAVGLLTRWASLAGMAYMAIGIWKEHQRWGFFMNWVLDPARGHGVEYAVVFMGALLCLTIAGAGEFSLDGRRAQSAAARASGRARLRRG